tara:strand:+ start:226 stop:582 length:357 start_codon:yes stop_codon:yes gene_type:complete
MKNLIFFNTDGIVEIRTTNKTDFILSDYPDFNSVKEYPNYFILYNNLNTDENKVKIPFTDDKFNGNIMIVKRKNSKIRNLTLDMYLKMVNQRNIKIENYISSSDSDTFEESCNLKQEC